MMQPANQHPRRLWRILPSGILHRCELLVSVDLEQAEALGLVETVKTEEFEFDAGVGGGLYGLFGGFVVDGDFLLGDVVLGVHLGEFLGVGGDLVEELGRHEVRRHEAVAEFQLAFLVLLRFVLLRHFGVLADLHQPIIDNVYAHLFLGRPLIHKLRHHLELILNHIAQARRIRHLQQDIINPPNMQILNVFFLQILNNSLFFHLVVDGTVSSWGQTDLALSFDDDVAVVVEGWEAALSEEHHVVFTITEVVVLLEEGFYLVVVHLGGHYVPVYVVVLGGGVVLLGQVAQSPQPLAEELEEGDAGLQADLEHSLGMVEAQSRTLPATHNTYSHYT